MLNGAVSASGRSAVVEQGAAGLVGFQWAVSDVVVGLVKLLCGVEASVLKRGCRAVVDDEQARARC